MFPRLIAYSAELSLQNTLLIYSYIVNRKRLETSHWKCFNQSLSWSKPAEKIRMQGPGQNYIWGSNDRLIIFKQKD